MNKIFKDAHYYVENLYGCAQAVLLSLQKNLELKMDKSFLKAAAPLGGGIGRMGDCCGGLTGGTLAIGLKFGRERIKEDYTALEKTHGAARKLYEKFLDKYKTTKCHDIQKVIFGRSYDTWTEYDEFIKDGALNNKGCPKVAGEAARWTGEIILEEESSTF